MKRLLIAIAMLCYVIGHGQREVRQYIFGHSLINHEYHEYPSYETPSQETSVPHWLHYLAQAGSQTYEVNGQYGFLEQHRNLPPNAGWGFDVVPYSWDSESQAFSEADFTDIMITPANYIQTEMSPTDFYYDKDFTPVSATIDVFDWCMTQEPGMRYYIYENWPDMGGYTETIPPTNAQWTAYNEYLQGGFHDWFIDYHDAVAAQYPSACVKMIPVGPIISEILLQAPYDQIPLTELYEDNAPHGLPSIYFLSAMINYMAILEEQTPANFTPDQTFIHPIIANNYSALRDLIWQELQDFDYADGTSRVFCTEPVTTSTVDLTVDASGITFHPNPCDQLLVIEGELSRFDLQIIDSLGQIHHTLDNTRVESTFDISSLPSGVYFIRIQDRTNAQLWIENLVKM